MAGLQDVSLGFGKESTFGTAVTPTRWFEITGDSDGFDIEFERVQGAGMRVSSRLPRSGRRVTTKKSVAGSFGVELFSKGQGLLLEAIFGAGSSALVSGSTYQQLFTLADTQPSYTVQQGVVDAGGTVNPYTYKGCKVTKSEFTFDDGICTVKTDWDGRELDTATGLTTPVMPSGGNLFHFANLSLTIGGVVTAPTSTVLATGGTAVTDVTDISVEIDRGLKTDRYTIGNAGLKNTQLMTGTQITGKFGLEYVSNTIRDAIVNDTALPLTITVTGGALSSGNETFQLVLPEVKLSAKGLPKQGGGDLSTLEVEFTALDNLTATQPAWGVVRTSDTAL